MAASSRVEFDGGEVSATGFGVDSSSSSSTSGEKDGVSTDSNVGLLERSISAAGAAVISAILVNPLDVAKVPSYFKVFIFIFKQVILRLVVVCVEK